MGKQGKNPRNDNRLSRISIVLVKPKLDENVGAVARAMKNFTAGNLILVAPQCDHLTEAARRRSCDAEEILEQACCFTDLAEALAPFPMVVGTTARLGKYCQPVYTPADMAAKIADLGAQIPVALVFGREDFGMDRETRRQCHYLSSIPVNPAFASLNLSQSVLLYCYELFREHGGGLATLPARDYATHAELEGMYGHLRGTLLDNHFFDDENPDHLMEYLRRLFGRVQMSRREVNMIRGIMHLIDKMNKRVDGD
ncbi:MAG: RNA methyltransferase [Deltaproteobacteria bacterium]|nr:RNA methyltransferase [Candidatus Anaeroferrophillus wilburensis]MBN2888195.1 RNA methyltransferase [Deltaproteobacteria bacterium]